RNMDDPWEFVQVPDGVILDVFSEYVWGSRSQAALLLQDNRAGCIDAVLKLLTMDALAPQIGMSERKNSSQVIILANQLSDANRLVVPPELSAEQRANVRPEARKWVLDEWENIDRAIATNPGIRDAWAGVVRREFRLYFLNQDPNWKSDHYEETA